jgi:geranylgeranyl reductase family protein
MTAANGTNGKTPASETIEADVVIIGAGPAGTAAAAHLGQLGMKKVVLVDKHDFPRDKTCGSGISPKGIEVLKALGVWDDVKGETYRINGLRLITPNGRESWQHAGDALEAVVCQRRTLDHLLLKRATSAGVRFLPHFTADSLLEEGGRIAGVRAKDGREVRARFTIVAGGTHCKLGPEGRPRHLIQAIMGWWEGVPFRPHHVEMIFDDDIKPYYGWLFPENDTRVNIGITYEDTAGKHNARELFTRFLDKYYKKELVGAKQLGAWKGHPVAYSYKIEKLSSPGRLVIGEAGLLTHPATAEGIYQGMKSGMLAADALHAIVWSGVSEEAAFARYERDVKKAFQLSFLGGGLFRHVVKTPVLDWLIAASERPAVQSATAKLMATM